MHGDTSQAAVECFHCDGHGAQFPACLQTSHTCHDDQDCVREIDHAHESCDFGGMEVHHKCQKCCDTTECVTQLSANLTAKLMADGGIMCPNGCKDDKPEDCKAHAVWCTTNQFCQITRDDHHNVKGECKDDHELKVKIKCYSSPRNEEFFFQCQKT
ncbi:hypothetical protein PoB_001483100 [Plakobranchus ocellatus]|uniref:Uncharacterized protein n=1 Tax=Plakobranchus ocellatus TaxID=259542 RepID=A0AAV3YM44_9GAST|nr:hypothetical protein PoB_001483100 [Plakobranchus ocellatus]